MKDAILRKARESQRETEAFFTAAAGEIERCARALAERLAAGGRLFTMGNGGSACDAVHAAVEFQHPIFEKRRPFPAQSLAADPALMSAIGNDTDFSRVFADALRVNARRGDAVLAISTSGQSANVTRGLEAARELQLLTIAFTGKDGGRVARLADHAFVVPSWSIHRIQEVHVVLLHVLWDCVHICQGEDDII